ncbi:MAG: nucleotide pyrophosphohydrolase [Elusimicrobia bacterium]|nr:nucleotide pyrophosphohydrolase [Elusimicrobiota bacterium]
MGKKTAHEDLAGLVANFARERDWDQFHTPKNLAMALAVEAAEIMELFQWLTPEQSAKLSKKERAALADELADVFVYLLRLASRFDIDLLEASRAKMKKNAKKYPVAKSRGIAKKYTDL